MEILIRYDHGEEDLEDLDIEGLATFVLTSENQVDACEVSIAFIDNETMEDLNWRHRQKKGPTDVLSFECDEEQDYMQFGECSFILGDVVIAPDIARSQALEYGSEFEEEIYLLLVHGLLHLCGYDHEEESEARDMEAREASLLSQWGKKQFDEKE